MFEPEIAEFESRALVVEVAFVATGAVVADVIGVGVAIAIAVATGPVEVVFEVGAEFAKIEFVVAAGAFVVDAAGIGVAPVVVEIEVDGAVVVVVRHVGAGIEAEFGLAELVAIGTESAGVEFAESEIDYAGAGTGEIAAVGIEFGVDETELSAEVEAEFADVVDADAVVAVAYGSCPDFGVALDQD